MASPGAVFIARTIPPARATITSTLATGSPELKRHLAFRDYLRTHPDCSKQYSDLKKKLSVRLPDSFERYMIGKDPFIKDIDQKTAAQPDQG